MNNENIKNPAELSEQELSSIAGGTSDNFDPDKAQKENEEWMKNNGIQFFGTTSHKFG